MTTSINPEFTNQSIAADNKASEWYWDDKTPGQGDKPDWLGDKYKSVADKARAHTELEKRLGTAPESYDTSKGDGWMDADYAPFMELMDFAKSKHVSQDVMDKMLDSVGLYLDEFKVDHNAERAKLGDKAEERLNIIDNWAKSNFTEETYNALTNNLRTADAIKAIEEVRNKMNSNTTTIPNSNHDANANIPSMQEMQAELNKNLQKYKDDPAYRREYTARLELAAKGAGFQDKQAY